MMKRQRYYKKGNPMKSKAAILIVLIIMILASTSALAQNEPEAYMEISATDEWGIFTKNMQDAELLSSVGKSTQEINEILSSTGSESVIINKQTGAQIYLKVEKNDLSYELWNISDCENVYITENLKRIVYDAFLMDSFNYQDEDVKIDDYAYMKFITIPGSAYLNEDAHGLVCGGTIVNGNAIVFTMVTNDIKPTEEEINAIGDIAKSVSCTVIKEKTEELIKDKNPGEKDVFNYILGGFGALVLIIFCVYMIMRMKGKEKEDEAEEIKEEQEEKEE